MSDKPKATTSCLKHWIARLPGGKVFTARHVLHMGRTSAVYQALSRLVNLGILIRLARGVYMKPDPMRQSIPPPDEVARVKAIAWGKRLDRSCLSAAAESNLVDERELKNLFLAGSSSSSFQSSVGEIRFKKTCPKKLLLGESKVAKLTKSLWHMGKEFCRVPSNVSGFFDSVWQNRLEREELITFAPIIPGWLRDAIIKPEHFNMLYWERQERTPSDRVTLASEYVPESISKKTLDLIASQYQATIANLITTSSSPSL